MTQRDELPKRFAGQGRIWVCGCCGKTAADRYGMEGEHSPGWDESCMLNAVLCHYPKGLIWAPVEAALGDGERITKDGK